MKTAAWLGTGSTKRRNALARQADGCLETFPIWDDAGRSEGMKFQTLETDKQNNSSSLGA